MAIRDIVMKKQYTLFWISFAVVFGLQRGPYQKIAWNQAPHWGGKGKNRRAKRAERCSLRVVKGSPVDIFPILPRFFPFSLTAEPGPRLSKTLWTGTIICLKDWGQVGTVIKLHCGNSRSSFRGRTASKKIHWKSKTWVLVILRTDQAWKPWIHI